MAEIVNLGSLYLNGQPKDLGVEYHGEVLSFGNTIPGKTIPFVKWGNLLVAARCVCTNISWEQLKKNGYIFGRLVKIDRGPYLCRSLKVGEEKDVPNEWDSILDELGEDDSLWLWDDQYFWGQETSRKGASARAVRGYLSARCWFYYYASDRLATVGFRPALEPLLSGSLISRSLIGSNLSIYGPDGDVCGQLVSFSDYDLIIRPSAQQILHDECNWACMTQNHIVIDRSAVAWTKVGV